MIRAFHMRGDEPASTGYITAHETIEGALIHQGSGTILERLILSRGIVWSEADPHEVHGRRAKLVWARDIAPLLRRSMRRMAWDLKSQWWPAFLALNPEAAAQVERYLVHGENREQARTLILQEAAYLGGRVEAEATRIAALACAPDRELRSAWAEFYTYTVLEKDDDRVVRELTIEVSWYRHGTFDLDSPITKRVPW